MMIKSNQVWQYTPELKIGKQILKRILIKRIYNENLNVFLECAFLDDNGNICGKDNTIELKNFVKKMKIYSGYCLYEED